MQQYKFSINDNNMQRLGIKHRHHKLMLIQTINMYHYKYIDTICKIHRDILLKGAGGWVIKTLHTFRCVNVSMSMYICLYMYYLI